MSHPQRLIGLFVGLLALLIPEGIVTAQGPQPGTHAPKALAGTAFTYQGQLKNGGVAVNQTCDFRFGL